MRILFVVLALLAAGCSTSAPQSSALPSKRMKAQNLTSVRAHPRLLATEDDFARAAGTTDPTLSKWRESVLATAKKLSAEPPVSYSAAKGIEVARELQRRVTHLALAYKITHEAQFLERAKANLQAACAFQDWQQPSFLATAEMTTAVAVGYDWLFNDLSELERASIRQAIVDKGLRSGAAAYTKGDFWTEAKHNWNLVCNGGMIVGSLAVIDESDNDLAQGVLDSARRSIGRGLAGFAPDGGWEEGPTYWNYGTRYLAFAMMSLRNTYGTTFDVERSPGLSRTGDFRIATVGPLDDNFNFADSAEAPGDSPHMFAAAGLFKRPAYAAFEARRSHRDPTVFDLLWCKNVDEKSIASLPKDFYFRGVDVASFRSSFDDPNATFVAFKGGTNRAHHGHYDLGTFVLDALGQRWAVDLGSDDYGAPGYFGAERPTFYRCSTVGHNTITFDGRNQDEDAVAPLIAYQSTKARAHAAIDLTHAYGPSVRADRMLRGVALLNRKDVLVQDQIDPQREMKVNWLMHSRAKVSVDGRTATLQQGGQTLTAHLLYPPGVTFEATAAPSPKGQSSNEGVTVLSINFRVEESTHIAVLFTPSTDKPQIPKLTPVSGWNNDEDGLAPPPKERKESRKREKTVAGSSPSRSVSLPARGPVTADSDR